MNAQLKEFKPIAIWHAKIDYVGKSVLVGGDPTLTGWHWRMLQAM